MENEDSSLIIGGDFNTYLNPLLDRDNTNNEALSKYGKELLSIMDQHDLIDIWRTLNPTTKRYTWRQKNPLIQSRLDYFLISLNLSYNIDKCDIKPAIKTDHSLIRISLSLNNCAQRGPGLWKFNSALLKDEVYLDYIKEVIEDLKIQNQDITDKGLLWDYIKSEIRERTITYSKTQSKIKRECENELLNDYNRLAEEFEKYNDKDILNELENTKQQLEIFNKEKTAGSVIRAKAAWLNENQRDTSYFVNLERKNYKIGHITKINCDNGNTITNPKEILEEGKRFYEKLYKHNENKNDSFDNFFLENNNIPKLDDNHVELCSKPISADECTKTLYKMNNGKTPGSDGISVEFYKMFWPTIKDLVFDSIRYGLDHGHLSIDQKRGVLKLIPKKDKDITYFKNWRPISLLNTDYKLLSHILADRIHQTIDKIIHTDQNGYIKGRFIGCNIRTILDMIEYSQLEEDSNLITFIDYEKAFDNIEWNFMKKSLKAFGFNNRFIDWINTLYKEIGSCIMNNGFTSTFFPITKGIRQGCPLSALLFVITVEILAIEIRTNKNVRGIVLNGKEIKISLLADDTTLFLKDIHSLHIVLNLMYMFKEASGLKLNYSKTQILQIGKQEWNIKPLKLKNEKEKVYSLGTWFYKDPTVTVHENQVIKLEEFKKILKQWQHRNLTLHGRIMVLKSLALSKLNFLFSSMEITKDLIEECQKHVNSFIWKNKPPKLKSSVSMKDYADGGIKIPHIFSYVKASKAIWAKRMLHENDNWMQYIKTFLPNISLKHLFKCNFNSKQIPFKALTTSLTPPPIHVN